MATWCYARQDNACFPGWPTLKMRLRAQLFYDPLLPRRRGDLFNRASSGKDFFTLERERECVKKKRKTFEQVITFEDGFEGLELKKVAPFSCFPCSRGSLHITSQEDNLLLFALCHACT